MDYNFITFDCYGTLIDWESGIANAFAKLGARKGWRTTAGAILEAYRQVEPVVEAEGYRSYRDVLAESSRRVARTFGLEIADSDIGFLAQSLPEWRPFADTNGALRRLRVKGVRLGILSNVDDDLLNETRKHLSVPFDLVITAQQVRSYKPALGHFLAARERLQGARWLHVAQSYFHDVVPCAALTIPCAWVNRKSELHTEDEAPTFEVHDLNGLADLLGA